jgi:hypothetical protein
MDVCVTLLARAAQCRRLASNRLDEAAIRALQDFAKELEERAAEMATARLREASEASREPGAAPGHYAIFRIQEGWLVSRNGDRMAVRATLADARSEAARLAGFDNQP